VHIIDGMLATPPASALEIRRRRFSARGSNACTEALISNATSSACQIDEKYEWKKVVAACHVGPSPVRTPPTARMLDPDQW
jgi:hypothetical protein